MVTLPFITSRKTGFTHTSIAFETHISGLCSFYL